MTCVVGLVDGDTVWLGADSVGIDGWSDRGAIATPKVCSVESDGVTMLVAGAGNFRALQILQNDCMPPRGPHNQDVYDWLVGDYVHMLRNVFKNEGYLKNNAQDQVPGSRFMVGVKGRLFQILNDFGVVEMSHRYDAIGSGYMYALGSLATTAELPKNHRPSAKNRVLVALESAARHNGSVMGPMTVLSV